MLKFYTFSQDYRDAGLKTRRHSGISHRVHPSLSSLNRGLRRPRRYSIPTLPGTEFRGYLTSFE